MTDNPNHPLNWTGTFEDGMRYARALIEAKVKKLPTDGDDGVLLYEVLAIVRGDDE